MATAPRAGAVSASDPAPAHVAALRFLLATGRVGEAISQGLAARVGDRENVGNLTVIVIADLALHGMRRPVDVQTATGLSSGGVTKLLDRLEAAGLVTRSHGLVPTDRRAIVLDLTAAGHEFAEQIAMGLIDGITETGRTFRELADEADAVAELAGQAG